MEKSIIPFVNNCIKRISDGEEEALLHLYKQYKTPVFRLALSILRDHQLAEDITQETFINVLLYSKQYLRDISEKAWVMKIARNLSLNLLKKRSYEKNDEEYLEKTIKYDSENGDFEFLLLISNLDEIDQEIIILHIISKLKHKETASILDMSSHAVKKRYERALKKLKAQFSLKGAL